MTTKADLINAIAKESGLTQAASEKALNACLKSIKESFRRGKRVSLKGFGSFTVVRRKEREAWNPHTGEKMIIPSKNVVKFNPGKMVKEVIGVEKMTSAL
ncbi:MAG: HU family DNA-binding protein [Desulfohalobiaceae bacterium]|nr:HU family DNA-binding protein [Desulfohalobiaceae bacterium]